MIANINCKVLDRDIQHFYEAYSNVEPSKLVESIVNALVENGQVDTNWHYLIYTEDGEYDEDADASIINQLYNYITEYIKRY